MEKLNHTKRAHILATISMWKSFLEEKLITEEEYNELVRNTYIEYGESAVAINN